MEQITIRKIGKYISGTETIACSLLIDSWGNLQAHNEVVQNKEQINIKYYLAHNTYEYD